MDELYFKFNNESIYLKDIDLINETSPHDHREFYNFISEYNLKDSYKKLKEANSCDIAKVPLYIVYKDKNIHISDFIKEHNEFSNTLEHLDLINGLEAKNTFRNCNDCNDKQRMIPIHFETCRLFQSVYEIFVAARFALLEGELKLHICGNMPWRNGSEAQFWFRSMYINNAILWYNSAFDALLQCLWIGKRLYTQCEKGDNDKKNYSINDIIANRNEILSKCDKSMLSDRVNYLLSDIQCQKTRNKILKKCTLQTIELDAQYKYLSEFRSSTKIATLANKLKHQGGLLYKETNTDRRIEARTNNYSSNAMLEFVNIDDVITELADYHKKFICIVERVHKDIQNDFAQYNLTI